MIASLQSRIHSLQPENSANVDLLEQLSQLSAKCTSLQAELCSSAVSPEENSANIQKTTRDLKESLVDRSLTVSSLSNTLGACQIALSERNAELARIRRELSVVSEEVEGLEQKVRKAEVHLRALQEERQSAQIEVESLTVLRETKRNSLLDLESEAETVELDMISLERKLRSAQLALTTARREAEKTRKQMLIQASEKIRASSLSAENHELRMQVSSISHALGELEEKLRLSESQSH